MVGEILAHYRVVRPLGSGGMGVVYEAEDLALNRRVALKTLPPAFALDESRRRRLDLEAKAVAALNHPNIVTVYSIEAANDQPFVTMELVEGHPLSSLIPKKGLPLGDVLNYGAQISDALAAAHTRGITHRDVKPANVIVTAEGRVKVLDFGLATLREDDADSLTTRTRSASEAQEMVRIVGTVAYMSPEQARGEGVDHRSDIFSLGILLYEMCTGRRPFSGPSTASLLSSIEHDVPPTPSEVNPDVPVELTRIVKRCLKKDRNQRYQDAKDLRNEIEELREELTSGVLERARRAARPASRVRVAWWVASLVVMAGAMLGAGFWLATGPLARRGAPPPAATLAPTLGNPVQVTIAPGWESDPVLSPDGALVAFTSNQDGKPGIWLTGFRGGSALHVAPSDGSDEEPAWFPDGSAIAFASDRGGRWNVWKVPALGGSATLLVENARDPALSADGSQIAFARPDAAGDLRLYAASLADRRQPRRLTAGASLGLHGEEDPAWSPDGRFICYTSNRSLWIVSAAGGEPRRLTRDDEYDVEPAWAPDGRTVYFSSFRGGVFALWQTTPEGGVPTRVTRGPGPERHPSVSLNGNRLAFSTFTDNSDIVLHDLQTGGQQRIGTTRTEVYPVFSHDRRWIVYVYDGGGHGGTELWLQPMVGGRPGGAPHQLTEPPGAASHPEFSPDDRWVAYQLTNAGRRDIWIVPAAGGPARQFTRDAGENVHPAWSPDGRHLVFVSSRDGTQQLWVAPVADGRPGGEPRRITQENSACLQPSWSPDGREVAYLAEDEKGPDVWIAGVSRPAAPRRVTTGAGAGFVRWDVRGRGLLVSGAWNAGERSIRRVDPDTGSTKPFDPPVAIGHPSGYPMFDVSSDRRFVVFSGAGWSGDIWVSDIIRRQP